MSIAVILGVFVGILLPPNTPVWIVVVLGFIVGLCGTLVSQKLDRVVKALEEKA